MSAYATDLFLNSLGVRVQLSGGVQYIGFFRREEVLILGALILMREISQNMCVSLLVVSNSL